MFAAFDFTSFYSVWYWVLSLAVWTQVCYRTLGVPYDMILRAERRPEVAAEVDALAKSGAARLAAVHRAAGSWLAALGGFALAGLAVLGLVNGVEPALATFMLGLPLALVAAMSVRLALHVERTGASGAALRRRLARRRAWNQTIAVAAVAAAALIGLRFHPAVVFLP